MCADLLNGDGADPRAPVSALPLSQTNVHGSTPFHSRFQRVKPSAISHRQKSNSVVRPRTGRVDIFPRDFGSPKGELIFKLLRARPVLGAFFFGELIFKLLRARARYSFLFCLSKGPSGLNRHWDLCEKFDFCARANLPLLHVTYTCTLDLPRIVGLKVLR